MSNKILSGYTCEHCGSFVKMYRRSLNSNMALAILLLYKFNIRDWVKVEDFLIKSGHKRCGDFSYLVHYGLLEKKQGDRSDGSSRNGFYKLTGRGLLFCEGKLMVQEKFLILHGGLKGFEGKEISIKEALGKKFDYSELMGLTPKTDKEAKFTKRISNNNIPVNNPLFG